MTTLQDWVELSIPATRGMRSFLKGTAAGRQGTLSGETLGEPGGGMTVGGSDLAGAEQVLDGQLVEADEGE